MCVPRMRFLHYVSDTVSDCQISLRDAGQDFREAARIDPTDFEIWQKYEETYRQGHRQNGVRSCMWTAVAGKLRVTLQSSPEPSQCSDSKVARLR